MPIISGGSGGTVNPATLAGYEIGYDPITATVNITGTSAATATTIITCAAHTFDGAAVLLEVFTPMLLTPTGGFAIVCLFESAAIVTQLGVVNGIASAQPGVALCLHYRFTPSAGSHSYVIAAYAQSTTGAPAVQASTAAGDVRPPAFARFTKV